MSTSTRTTQGAPKYLNAVERHQDLIWQLTNASNDLDKGRAITNTQLELNKLRTRIEHMTAHMLDQRETIGELRTQIEEEIPYEPDAFDLSAEEVD